LRSIASLQHTADVRLRSSIFARLASEIFLSSLHAAFSIDLIENMVAGINLRET
jgi:hypothetical protein